MLNMQTPQQILKAKKLKQKILKKYISTQDKPINKKTSINTYNGLILKDNDNSNENSQLDESLQSQSSQNIQTIKRRRVDSDDQDNDQQKLKKIYEKSIKYQQNDNINIFKDKKMMKKFKKAFGIDNDQEMMDFLKQMKIQGMSLKQVKKLLKSKKVNIQLQVDDQQIIKQKKSKKAKKQKKQKTNKKDKIKFQAMIQSQSQSDIQIPDHARTIYRNKDGTIKLQTQTQKKQKKKKQVYDRLADWQKGMKKQDSDQQDNDDLAYAKNDVWDDPLKLWNQQNIIKPFQCKFSAPANRFDIKPGHRWDGVIRGNGFQNKVIQEQNLKKAKVYRQNKQYLKNL